MSTVIAIGCTASVAQEGSKQGTGASASHSQGSAQQRLNSGGASGTGGAMQATPGGGAAQNQALPEKQGMGSPEGTLQNEKRGSSTRQRGAEENNNMQRGAEENNRTNMQRGAEGNSSTNMRRGAEENNRTNMRGAEENNGTNMRRGAEENERRGVIRENRENNARIQGRGGRSDSSSAKSVQLSESQRTQIKNIIIKHRNVARVHGTNFPVAVGTAVPHNVHVAVLLPDVVRVVPEYKGFDYIVAEDQLLIIDPDTMEIIAILPV